MPLTKDDILAGSYYKLLEPAWAKTYGQGSPPKEMNISVPGKDYSMPWGTIFKASGSCDPDNCIANLNASGYPLLRIEFIQAHLDQFEEVIIGV